VDRVALTTMIEAFVFRFGPMRGSLSARL